MLWAPEIPIWFSLVFIGATITVAAVASLIKTRNDDRRPSVDSGSSDDESTAADAAPGNTISTGNKKERS